MIIEFPKKYTITVYHDSCPVAFIDVPLEYHRLLVQLLNEQPWASVVGEEHTTILLSLSRAYDIGSEQAYNALCQLCEHVMSPPAEVDREVWGDALLNDS